MDAVIGLDKSNGISGFAKFSVFFVENYKNAKIRKCKNTKKIFWLSRLITACRFHFLKKKKFNFFGDDDRDDGGDDDDDDGDDDAQPASRRFN